MHFLPSSFIVFTCLIFCIQGCASSMAGPDSPKLPATHWLKDGPGIPKENKPKLQAVFPHLYEPNRIFNFEECVYLAVQKSPLLVNSAVELEIKRVSLTDSVWKFIPEPHMIFSITNNMTGYNYGARDKPRNYGELQYEIGFYTQFPNPIKSYFEHAAKDLMVNLALSSHRKAVSETIYKIASTCLELEAQRKINDLMDTLPGLNQELVRYWEQVEVIDGRQSIELALAQQKVRESELTRERGKMQETALLTRLKMLVGIDPRQQLLVEPTSANKILNNFNGKKESWEDRWLLSEDQQLLRWQIKLADYNIMVAWASYVPDLSLQMNKNPPAGQYQPAHGLEDQFLHLNFTFPLIDWGRRYREVQTSRMQKAQMFHRQTNARIDFSNAWLQAEQRTAMTENNVRIAQIQAETAEMRQKEANISYEAGLTNMPLLVNAKETLVNMNVNLINVEKEFKLAMLHWMFVSGLLQQHFLGLPQIAL